MLPKKTLSWNISIPDEISIESLSIVVEEEPRIEILLIGCGKVMELLPRDLMKALRLIGMAVDTMDTGAACRTYNVLAAEGRRVAAGMIALD